MLHSLNPSAPTPTPPQWETWDITPGRSELECEGGSCHPPTSLASMCQVGCWRGSYP